jgi:60 kDa SS-A/Ro ribonucleoprotein
MEIATENVPRIDGRVVICPDVSGSMGSPVTGYRKGATTKVRCIDVAGLIASAFLRVNRGARVLPFATDVVRMELNPRDTVMTNAEKLASAYGGGTNCSAPVRQLAKENGRIDLVVIVSDNQSWVDARPKRHGTALMEEWMKLKAYNPDAKLVCIDIQPYGTLQATNRDDILNVGGFSELLIPLNPAAAMGSDTNSAKR